MEDAKVFLILHLAFRVRASCLYCMVGAWLNLSSSRLLDQTSPHLLRQPSCFNQQITLQYIYSSSSTRHQIRRFNQPGSYCVWLLCCRVISEIYICCFPAFPVSLSLCPRSHSSSRLPSLFAFPCLESPDCFHVAVFMAINKLPPYWSGPLVCLLLSPPPHFVTYRPHNVAQWMILELYNYTIQLTFGTLDYDSCNLLESCI